MKNSSSSFSSSFSKYFLLFFFFFFSFSLSCFVSLVSLPRCVHTQFAAAAFGVVGAIGYGLYSFSRRDSMMNSLAMMRFRVGFQFTAVCAVASYALWAAIRSARPVETKQQ
jgi:hypothetical protein